MKILSIHKNNFQNNKVVNIKQQNNSQHFTGMQGQTSTKKNTSRYLLIAGILAAALVAGIYFIRKGRKATPHTTAKETAINNIKTTIITGKKQIATLLKSFTQDDFDANKTFKTNLHIHSTKSDGNLAPLEILNQAVEYSKQLPPEKKFTFSLTDHDTIDGVREIAKEIAQNPEKYKKINFIPGIELSSSYKNPNLADGNAEFDFLIYGFDVNDHQIINEVNRRKNYLIERTQNLFEEINLKYPDFNLSVEKMQKEAQNKTVKNICSNGYLKALKEWLKTILPSTNEDFLDAIATKHFGHNKYAYDANLPLLDAINLAKETNSISALAHPGKFNFKHAKVKNSHTGYAADLLSTFIKNGGDAIEYNYMSYKPETSWWPKVRNCLDDLNLTFYKTGGYDTHGKNIACKN